MSATKYLHLRSGAPLPALSLPPFKAIVVAEEATETSWRYEVCAWLIRGGCMSFAAWGEACEAWHDDADKANMADLEREDIPDDRLVMTTWHDSEPLSEALWFVACAALHPTFDLVDALIIHVAQNERAGELLKQYDAAADL